MATKAPKVDPRLRQVNYWFGKRVCWQEDGKGERQGLVTTATGLGRGAKECNLTVATDDGWLVYLSSGQVTVVA